ncbi:phosphatase 2C-like domain-containing protein [Hyaloraphidium curvatum]|nr:phosphatase 2C-like domain-containing protein [Hyaloraphidium curvatum]
MTRRKSIWQTLGLTPMDAPDPIARRGTAMSAAASVTSHASSRPSGDGPSPGDHRNTSTDGHLSPAPVPQTLRRKSILDFLASPFRRGSQASAEPSPATPAPPAVPDYFSYFGVFDGHAGQAAAEYVAGRMHEVLPAQKSFAQGNYIDAMKEAFEAMDTELRGVLTDPSNPIAAGACATVAIVVPEPPAAAGAPTTPTARRLVIGNVGDVRGVLSCSGRAVRMTVDHEPTLELEKARITRAGGWVDMDGRVNGYIMVSRSLGDFSGKSQANRAAADQLISNVPDVGYRTLAPDDELLLVASDGIWSVYESDQDVLNFVLGRLCYRNMPLPKVLEELLAMIYMLTKGTSRCDNKTVMAIAFLREGEDEEAWVARIKADLEKRLPPGMETWDFRDGVGHAEGLLTCELVPKKPAFGKKKAATK